MTMILQRHKVIRQFQSVMRKYTRCDGHDSRTDTSVVAKEVNALDLLAFSLENDVPPKVQA